MLWCNHYRTKNHIEWGEKMFDYGYDEATIVNLRNSIKRIVKGRNSFDLYINLKVGVYYGKQTISINIWDSHDLYYCTGWISRTYYKRKL